MDYMVYVDNSNDRFSLLDMIEKDCEAWDSDEKRRMSHGSEVFHADKKLFANELRQPVQTIAAQFGEGCWTDSASLKVVPLPDNISEAAAGVNKDPHLLVNPRTVAPLLESHVAEVAVSAMPVSEKPAISEAAFCEVEPRAKLIKIDSSECELLPSQARIVSLTNADQNYSTGTALLTPASVNVTNPVSTMQVFLQVASTVGSLMQTGGSVCFVVEPQTLCTNTIAQKSENDSAATAGMQLADSDASIKEEPVSETYEKPVFSYSCLIAMALKNSDTGSLPVNEIYAYILEKFPYFRSAPDGWKNSIRHNLSLNKCFEKIENPTVNGGSRKGCLWGLNPAKADKMDEEIAKWIKRASKSNGTINGVAYGNLVDCSAITSAQNGVAAPLVSDISDDAVSGSLQNSGGNVVICHDIQQTPSCPAVSTDSEYFTMLEDSFSSDPMLAGLAVQNGLWDDLTETDELMSTAMSFSGTQLAARGVKNRNKSTEPSLASSNNVLLTTSAPGSTTCRSIHSKAGVTISSGRGVDASDVIVISQPAIG